MKTILMLLLIALVLIIFFCAVVTIVSVIAERLLDEELPKHCRGAKAPRLPRG